MAIRVQDKTTDDLSPIGISEEKGHAEGRIDALRQLIFPLTKPSLDQHGNTIQLWSVPGSQVMGVLQRPDGSRLTISPNQVHNALNFEEDPTTLHNRLLSSPEERVWDFVFQKNGHLVIWPHTSGGGWHEAIPRSNQEFSGISRLARGRTQEQMCAWFYSSGYQVAEEKNPPKVEIHLNGASAGIYNATNHKTIRNLLQQGGKIQTIHYAPPSDKEKKDNFAGKGLVFQHPKDRSRSTFNVDFTKKNGRPEYDGGYHIDVKGDALRGKIKVSTQETYKENYSTRGQEHRPYELKDCPPSRPHTNPAMASFRQVLQQTGLTNSYNSVHADNPMPQKGMTGGEIGGVACSTSYIEGLFDDVPALLLDNYYFAFPVLPGESAPFTNAELQQILRELAIGVYVHSTVPFFSLHFREKGTDLFPVIHPVYENTLVGRVIGMLDYIMKGYLNGGIYKDDFIENWHKNPDWESRGASSLEQLIGFVDYCKTRMDAKDQSYCPLSFMSSIVEKDPLAAEILSSFKGFRNSFRIIAKQNGIQKEGNLLLVNPDFDVFYEINPSPEYAEALEAHIRKYGKPPSSHLQMELFYQKTTMQIHDHMAKMPLCKKYFSMLGVISFFSSYFSTLKQHRKSPRLPVAQKAEVRGCPPLFPHLPVTKRWDIPLKISFRKVGEAVLASHRTLIEDCINQFINREDPSYQFGAYISKLWGRGNRSEQLRVTITQVIVRECIAQVWDGAGLVGRKFLASDVPFSENLKLHIRELGTALATQILDGWVQDVLQTQKSLNNRPYLGGDWHYAVVRVAQMRKEFISQCLQVFQHLSDTVVEIVQFSKVATLAPNDRDSVELERTNRVVGGCGLHLEKQRVQPSIAAKKLLQENALQLQNLESEKWVLFQNVGAAPRALLRLFLENTPSMIEEDYEWMESLLVSGQSGNRDAAQKNLELQRSMREGDKKSFTELLASAHQALSFRDPHGRTLLHHAACYTDPFYAAELLKAGCLPTERDENGYLPMHYAVMQKKTATLQVLFQKKLVNAEAVNGARVLSVAILHQSVKAVEFLLREGAMPALLAGGYTDLHSAIHEGNMPIIEQLLSTPSFSSCLNVCSNEGGTLLTLACELDALDLVQKLITAGANPTLARRDGITAIEIAIARGSIPLLTYLLTQTTPSSQAIESAVKEGSAAVIQALRPHINGFTNLSQDNAIHIAIYSGNLFVALALIQDSPRESLVKTNANGQSPLSLAIDFGNWAVIKALINKGVEISTREIPRLLSAPYDPFLKTILSSAQISPEELQEYALIAAQAGNHQAVQGILWPLGINPTACKGLKGWEILHYLAKSDGLLFFELLVERERNFRKPIAEEKNLTLAAIAARHGSYRVFKYLCRRMQETGVSFDNAHEDKHLLYIAIEEGLEEGLLETHAHTLMDSKGRRAAHVAGWMGAASVLEKLASYGADLKSPDQKGITPLDYAVRAQSPEAVSFLLSKGVPVTGQALYWAAKAASPLLSQLMENAPSPESLTAAREKAQEAQDIDPKIQALFAALSEEEVPQDLMQSLSAKQLLSTWNGKTALHLIAAKAEPSVFREVLAAQSSHPKAIEVVDASGNTPLFYAIEAKSEHNMTLLLARGANVQHKNNQLISPLGKACGIGFLEMVKKLLRAGGNPNQLEGTKQHPPLWIAALANHSSVVHCLLSHGAKVDFKQKGGCCLVHLLAASGKTTLLRSLVARGVSVDFQDDEGKDARYYAARAGQTKTLEFLLNLEPSPLDRKEGAQLLTIASACGHAETVRFLLGRGVTPSVQISDEETPFTAAAVGKGAASILPLFNSYHVSKIPQQIRLAIMQAIRNDNLAAVKVLFSNELGIDLDLVPNYTALHLASQHGAVHCTQWLLSRGCNPYLPCASGLNSFELAAENTSGETSFEQFQLLLDYVEPPLDQAYSQEITLMHRAAEVGNLQHLGVLIEQGASLNPIDCYKNTPLHRAAEIGHANCARLLLACGADASICSSDGKTSADLVRPKDTETAKVFEQFARIKPVKGESSLHRAIRTESLLALQLLAGTLDPATIDQKDENGVTALRLAIDMGNKEMILSLLHAGATLSKEEADLIKTFDEKRHS
ncbi:MAG: hypothetical protein HW387_735 [Parachlamydiales bacterium]|nr:hypothetical protein [Parachlamydiales bacterium]